MSMSIYIESKMARIISFLDSISAYNITRFMLIYPQQGGICFDLCQICTVGVYPKKPCSSDDTNKIMRQSMRFTK